MSETSVIYEVIAHLQAHVDDGNEQHGALLELVSDLGAAIVTISGRLAKVEARRCPSREPVRYGGGDAHE